MKNRLLLSFFITLVASISIHSQKHNIVRWSNVGYKFNLIKNKKPRIYYKSTAIADYGLRILAGNTTNQNSILNKDSNDYLPYLNSFLFSKYSIQQFFHWRKTVFYISIT